VKNINEKYYTHVMKIRRKMWYCNWSWWSTLW